MEWLGISLVVQWLRLLNATAGGLGLIPGEGTRSHMLQLGVRMLLLKISHASAKWSCMLPWRSHMMQLRPGYSRDKYFFKRAMACWKGLLRHWGPCLYRAKGDLPLVPNPPSHSLCLYHVTSLYFSGTVFISLSLSFTSFPLFSLLLNLKEHWIY